MASIWSETAWMASSISSLLGSGSNSVAVPSSKALSAASLKPLTWSSTFLMASSISPFLFSSATSLSFSSSSFVCSSSAAAWLASLARMFSFSAFSSLKASRAAFRISSRRMRYSLVSAGALTLAKLSSVWFSSLFLISSRPWSMVAMSIFESFRSCFRASSFSWSTRSSNFSA